MVTQRLNAVNGAIPLAHPCVGSANIESRCPCLPTERRPIWSPNNILKLELEWAPGAGQAD